MTTEPFNKFKIQDFDSVLHQRSHGFQFFWFVTKVVFFPLNSLQSLRTRSAPHRSRKKNRNFCRHQRIIAHSYRSTIIKLDERESRMANGVCEMYFIINSSSFILLYIYFVNTSYELRGTDTKQTKQKKNIASDISARIFQLKLIGMWRMA